MAYLLYFFQDVGAILFFVFYVFSKKQLWNVKFFFFIFFIKDNVSFFTFILISGFPVTVLGKIPKSNSGKNSFLLDK